MAPGTFALLAAWGTLSGMDLVTFPQGLFSRPLIACAGAGVILGDVSAGLVAGVLLELFALDVLPVGASRLERPAKAVAGKRRTRIVGTAS